MVKNLTSPPGSTIENFLHSEIFIISDCFFHMEKKTW
jgi:hypothetical protein